MMNDVMMQALEAGARGLPVTVALWVGGVFFGLLLGLLVACLRHFGPRGLSLALGIPVEMLRGTPFLVQCFLLYFGGPFIGIDLPAALAGLLALSVYGAAYFSEIFRAGFAAIPKGHTEAARLLGINTWQNITRIQLPAMALAVVPSLVNLAVILSKETAVLSIITVPELTFTVMGVGSATFAYAQALSVLAGGYWILVEATAWAARRLEARIARALGHSPAVSTRPA